jgi:hypothetical protein
VPGFFVRGISRLHFVSGGIPLMPGSGVFWTTIALCRARSQAVNADNSGFPARIRDTWPAERGIRALQDRDRVARGTFLPELVAPIPKVRAPIRQLRQRKFQPISGPSAPEPMLANFPYELLSFLHPRNPVGLREARRVWPSLLARLWLSIGCPEIWIGGWVSAAAGHHARRCGPRRHRRRTGSQPAGRRQRNFTPRRAPAEKAYPMTYQPGGRIILGHTPATRNCCRDVPPGDAWRAGRSRAGQPGLGGA